MASVTQRIDNIKQPRNGYLPVKNFQKTVRESSEQLYDMEYENVSAPIIGMAVDYLTRINRVENPDKEDIFRVALKGAYFIHQEELAVSLLVRINGLDDESIIAACKLSCFDAVVRGGILNIDVSTTNPNSETIYNIRTMVNRSLGYFLDNPVVLDGFTFDGGYTNTVNSGDGDYLTADTLLDFKVSKNNITSKHTLQILMYWRMGMHSTVAEFRTIKKLGIYNPRLDTEWIISVDDIPQEVIEEVDNDVIGYGNPTSTPKPRVQSPQPPLTEEKTYSVADIAEKLHINKKAVYDLIKRGYLPDTKKGRAYCFTSRDVLAMCDRLEEDIKEQERERKRRLITSIVVSLTIIAIAFAVVLGIILR